MSWRFRKTFRVLPGVKLNLTRSGLSATIGAAPFSVNVGPRGVYRNLSIPGTGLLNRERIVFPDSDHNSPGAAPSLLPQAAPLVFDEAPTGQIRSASTEALNSESMAGFRRLLTDAYQEQTDLRNEIAGATHELNSAKTRFEKWERGFLFKRMFKQSFAGRKEAFETASAKVEELNEQFQQTTLATEITIDKEQAEPYYRMRDQFAILSGSQVIWNVMSKNAIDRVKERSAADSVVTRHPVTFSLDSCDLIKWEQTVPHLPNRTGGDMYVYPGFILYRASKASLCSSSGPEVWDRK